MPSNYAKGSAGENLAWEYLARAGYTLRHKNWRTRRGELDLVVTSPRGEWVFVEVKSNAGHGAGSAEQWITPAKVRKLQRLAQAYCHLEKVNADSDIRFDVLAVDLTATPPRIRHYPNAFLPDANNYY